MAEPITKGSDTTRHQLDYTSSSTTSSYTTANSSPTNSTSTYRYEHEPFESFQHRIPKLGPQLGGEITEIQRLRGSGYNRVVRVLLQTESYCGSINGVVRVPRDIKIAVHGDDGHITLNKPCKQAMNYVALTLKKFCSLTGLF
ncbi:hypothetical protein LTS18_003671 [Coniosporium uncinatum]|uniref:Uncharacterized protein n=1 Tax=Coniosporium uncinatum TaxID=93489 RepID=A0ACC3D6Z5_9PEZI|nr:hypothetical protein LTS18_003671 [Coniosporium uncinatum]